MKVKLGSATAILLLAFWLLVSLAGAQSLGELARKAREEKKQEGRKATRVFTNDNLPSAGTRVSVVGQPPPAPKEEGEEAGGEAAAEGEAAPKEAEKPKEERGETYWRARFAEHRGKIAAAEKELDILQRELNLMQQQYYSDPNEALREQNQRTHINTQIQKINSKQEDIAKLKSELSALEDELRKEGGNSGWAR